MFESGIKALEVSQEFGWALSLPSRPSTCQALVAAAASAQEAPGLQLPGRRVSLACKYAPQKDHHLKCVRDRICPLTNSGQIVAVSFTCQGAYASAYFPPNCTGLTEGRSRGSMSASAVSAVRDKLILGRLLEM